MKLADVVKNVKYELLSGSLENEVKAITIDSRKASEGTLFVAIEGFTVDGHRFIPSAVKSGAAAVICSKAPSEYAGSAAYIKVENPRVALAGCCKNFFGNPSSDMNIIGVTGTNGKTSTTYFLEEILKENGRKTGVIGTVEIRADGEKLNYKLSTSTTPDTIELNTILCDMTERGCSDVAMEVSSHGLQLYKVDGVEFNVGIFTNLTQDHLDLHGTMENYLQAKARLFKMCRIGVLNADDSYFQRMKELADCEIITYGIENDCDIKAVNIEYKPDRVLFDILYKGESYHVNLVIPGKFSVYNALSAVGGALCSGVPMETIVTALGNIKGVPGRIQNVAAGRDFNVFVDYAHTPDGVLNIINAVRAFTKGRVITVFGCGGDRDRTKRPIMGEISARLSDYSIITSDNPRTEEPMAIIKEVEAGVKPVTDKYEILVSRRDAIFRAIEMAKAGDSVIIAGKGHEDYEIFKDKTIHFDDAEVAREALGTIKA
ncbi:MAG: UDP-N-acetylmuramoyl-L-alanyl-D-glutamate--2,6-diaminopimelate ligase [Clostridiales bacterium]|nr:UDP-N-acetylmuramoyl-L-alanyl-D-glutamate--2,6-diaminopimelate ligase [Clostridiales bacterium]